MRGQARDASPACPLYLKEEHMQAKEVAAEILEELLNTDSGRISIPGFTRPVWIKVIEKVLLRHSGRIYEEEV